MPRALSWRATYRHLPAWLRQEAGDSPSSGLGSWSRAVATGGQPTDDRMHEGRGFHSKLRGLRFDLTRRGAWRLRESDARLSPVGDRRGKLCSFPSGYHQGDRLPVSSQARFYCQTLDHLLCSRTHRARTLSSSCLLAHRPPRFGRRPSLNPKLDGTDGSGNGRNPRRRPVSRSPSRADLSLFLRKPCWRPGAGDTTMSQEPVRER